MDDMAIGTQYGWLVGSATTCKELAMMHCRMGAAESSAIAGIPKQLQLCCSGTQRSGTADFDMLLLTQLKVT